MFPFFVALSFLMHVPLQNFIVYWNWKELAFAAVACCHFLLIIFSLNFYLRCGVIILLRIWFIFTCLVIIADAFCIISWLNGIYLSMMIYPFAKIGFCITFSSLIAFILSLKQGSDKIKMHEIHMVIYIAW